MPEIHLNTKENILYVADMPPGHGPDLLKYPSEKASAVIKEVADELQLDPESVEEILLTESVLKF